MVAGVSGRERCDGADASDVPVRVARRYLLSRETAFGEWSGVVRTELDSTGAPDRETPACPIGRGRTL